MDGKPLDEAVDGLFSSLPALFPYKALIYEITSGVIRWKLYLDWVLSHFAKRAPDREVRILVWMTLYQVFFMRKAAYHVVAEAVDYAKKEKGKRVANFVNAVVRRSIRERTDLPMPLDPLSRLSVEQSFPRWLVARWLARFGPDRTRDLLSLQNLSPEFSLRIDNRRISREAVEARLNRLGIGTRAGRLLPETLCVDRVGPLVGDELLTNHLVHIQDEASQMAAMALSPSALDRILDACAGKGTKTDQIRELWPEVRIVAMDLEKRGLLESIGASYLVQGDATKNPFKKEVFDSILLDAPCSSLGIVRKHPEIRWRRKEADIARHGVQQREMIEALSQNLKSGGRLVYSVCSFEPEETIDVVEGVQKTLILVLEHPPHPFPDAPYFLSLPHETGADGFFIACLRKP